MNESSSSDAHRLFRSPHLCRSFHFQVKNVDDFLVAGRSLGSGLLAANIGAGSTVGARTAARAIVANMSSVTITAGTQSAPIGIVAGFVIMITP